MVQKPLEKIEVYESTCVLGKKIRTTKRYFEFITQFKHPELKGKLKEVLKTITEADEVRRNPQHPEIHFYYRKFNRHWICVVARHLNGEGFIVTAYLTSRFKKKGEKIWAKEK
ncbi:MAG: DUF4258 domain-containing protein [Candidatus Omnitrophota bacterium]